MRLRVRALAVAVPDGRRCWHEQSCVIDWWFDGVSFEPVAAARGGVTMAQVLAEQERQVNPGRVLLCFKVPADAGAADEERK